MNYCVFIHTNHKQALGAKVAAYALKRNSSHANQFEIKIIHTQDYPWIRDYDGSSYLRDGIQRTWLYEDLQSFTPLRFLPPELMNFEGRAVVMDPDIFAVADIWDLLTRDMQGKAILCRPRGKTKSSFAKTKRHASSVMLLDNALLKHWQTEKIFKSMFNNELDYHDWICLKTEPEDSIGHFENEWNDFDRLTGATRMLHNTKRLTQPWKTGLPIDWRIAERFALIKWFFVLRRKLFGEYAFLGNYREHPDKNQEQFFFGLLKECLDQGVVTKAEVEEEMANNHIRHDTLEILQETGTLRPWPAFPLPNIDRIELSASN